VIEGPVGAEHEHVQPIRWAASPPAVPAWQLLLLVLFNQVRHPTPFSLASG
jgi:hypothetical protein